MVPGLAHVVSSCCDAYLSSVTAPVPMGKVKPFLTPSAEAERSPKALPEAA